MRSASPDDATTRARIRDAAVELFGRNGFRATTVRAIAAEVGVSAALVLHHFGSKDGLRLACNEYVLAHVMAPGERVGNGTNPQATAVIRDLLTNSDETRPWRHYIGALVSAGDDAGDQLFDVLVAYTEEIFAAGVADGSVHESIDPHMRAVTLTAYSMATLLLERQFGRVVGADVLTPEAIKRMAVASIEIYTHGVYTNEALLTATLEALDIPVPDATANYAKTTHAKGADE